MLTAVVSMGCKRGADAFFSGRPSGMSMVHNRIIGGGPETMDALLNVPSRFPDADDAQIGHWQDSVIAWWNHKDKHAVMVTAYSTLDTDEMRDFQKWLRVRGANQSDANATILNEIEKVLSTNP
jgi:hypothetical protein